MTDETGDAVHGLPREDRGPVLSCIHPTPGRQCDEEAAWYVWYAGGITYTYSCHEHLIERLRDVRYSIVQIKRTPRWGPHTMTPEEIADQSISVCYKYYEGGWVVGDLIAYLQQCDPTAIVVLSSDAEGNRYSPLRVVDTTYYEAESTYSGEVSDDGPGVPCVALWPIN